MLAGVAQSVLAVALGLSAIALSREVILRQALTRRPSQEVALLDTMHGVVGVTTARSASRMVHALLNVVIANAVILLCGRLHHVPDFLVKVSVMYTLRAILNVCTHLPSPSPTCQHKTSLMQTKNQCNDLMYSGHQAIATLMIKYMISCGDVTSVFGHSLLFAYGLAICLSKDHYTIDVVIGYLVASAIFHS